MVSPDETQAILMALGTMFGFLAFVRPRSKPKPPGPLLPKTLAERERIVAERRHPPRQKPRTHALARHLPNPLWRRWLDRAIEKYPSSQLPGR